MRVQQMAGLRSSQSHSLVATCICTLLIGLVTVTTSLSFLTCPIPCQGLDSGFQGGEDDMYNVYDKPWRAGGGAADKIYRPSKNLDKDLYGDDLEKLIKTNRCGGGGTLDWSDQNGGLRASGIDTFLSLFIT